MFPDVHFGTVLDKVFDKRQASFVTILTYVPKWRLSISIPKKNSFWIFPDNPFDASQIAPSYRKEIVGKAVSRASGMDINLGARTSKGCR